MEGLAIEGELHLLTRPAYPPGAETPLEMLNRPDAFFALTLEDGGVTFIPKAQVVEVVLPPGGRPSSPIRTGSRATKHVDARGRHAGRRPCTAAIATLELPPNRSRALDFVNGSGPFFAIWSDGANRYINKSHVRLIRPFD